MNRFIYTLCTLLILAFPLNHLRACGFNFVGDCSTSVGLRINNTLDSFAIASCPFGTVFNGLDLGPIQSLALANARGITWESCQNNVTNMALYYRVFPSGQPGGAWQSLNLLQDTFTLIGPYTTRYRSKESNVNLTSALTPGQNYVLEVYFRAEIDTIGDDFIPETFLLQNNNGQNYRLNFDYEGPAAPPFTVVATKEKDVYCHGEANGEAGVTVYGNQTGLFYTWAGFSNNFPVLGSLEAGTYTVTVSGVGGYTQSQSITVNEPAAIEEQIVSLTPVSCGGQTGQVTVQASGGFAPYTYDWSTGQQASSTSIPTSGDWLLTITDARACTAVFSVYVPGSPAAEKNVYQELCAGETLTLGGENFTQTGSYNVLLAGPGGCDTLLHLTLIVLDANTLIADLPSAVALTCAQPSVELCLQEAPNATYWWQDAAFNLLSTSRCLTLTDTGELLGTALVQGILTSCSATKTVAVAQFFEAPQVSTSVVNASGPNAADGTITVQPSGGLPPYTVSWNEFGSSTDTVVVIEQVMPGEYCFTVTDAGGCTSEACATVSFVTGLEEQKLPLLALFPNPVRPGEWLNLGLPAALAAERIDIFDAIGRKVLTVAIPPASTSWRLQLPQQLSPGVLRIRVSGRSQVDGNLLLWK